MSRSAISLLYGSAGGLVDEFWPDIKHKFVHHHDRDKDPHDLGTDPKDK